MKVNARYVRSLFDSNGDREITLKIPNRYQARELVLSEDTDYTIQITKAKSKRSLNQNNYLWKLLEQIGNTSNEDMWQWYLKALKESKAKVEYVIAPIESFEMLKQKFRAVETCGLRTIVNPDTGKETEAMTYRIYLGSSTFNTEEMTKLLDIVIGWCYEYGIEPELYRMEEMK